MNSPRRRRGRRGKKGTADERAAVDCAGEDQLDVGGIALSAGRVRIYVCAQGFGIVAHASADEGRTWTRESTMVPQGILGARTQCDPSLVAGTSRFIYKIQP